jgi:hypothetical protein
MINGGGESLMAGLPKIDGDKLGNRTGIGSFRHSPQLVKRSVKSKDEKPF